jgi:hypothetical protein
MLRAPLRLFVFVALLVGGLLASGCDIGDFGDLNDDPTSPNQVDADLLFSRSIAYGTLRYTTYQRSQHLFGNMYSQYFANLNPDFTTTDRYQSDPPYNAWATSLWRTTYASRGGENNIGENVENSGINIQIAINQTRDDPQMINITSQAQIWKVYLMHRVTDAWGSVPYFEAFKGLEGNRTPAYDPQEEIYRTMLDTLDAAAERIDPSIQGNRFRLGSADLLYNDDLTKWRRFANSLRLRLALRVAEAAPDLAREHVNDAFAGGLMQSSDDSALRPTSGEGQFITQNPLSILYGFNDDRLSETLIDTLRALDDPRLTVYADTIATFGILQDTLAFRGLPNGLSGGTLSGIQAFEYSRLGSRLRRSDAPVPVMRYAEVKFLQAEAALRGWGSGSAQAHYEEGIRASLAYYDVPASARDDYLSQPGVAWNAGGSGAAQLEQIITQKWIALFTQGLELWAEYRRTGYPTLQPIPTDGQTGGAVPSRMLYPNVERTTNTQNVEDAAQQIGGDAMTTDLWWDQERSDLVRSDGSE